VYRCPPKGDSGCGGRTIRIEDLERLMEKLVFAKLEEVEPLDEGTPTTHGRLSKKSWKSGSAA
jgi:site-specific DNA recombinase